jgi:hypothetical protein
VKNTDGNFKMCKKTAKEWIFIFSKNPILEVMCLDFKSSDKFALINPQMAMLLFSENAVSFQRCKDDL